jgi:uncharacterized membrane protein
MSALFILTLGAALGCALVAGVFFAFSTFVMRALARLPAAAGIAAMQAINVAVLRSGFMAVFLGTSALCVLALAGALLYWREPAAPWWLAGATLYLLGSLLVTMRFNVPRNNALAALAPDDPAAGRRWAEYQSGWNAWNHVRAGAALIAAILFVIALVYLAQPH